MDPVHFTGREVLDMAVKIEENGLRFYTDASKSARTDGAKKLFTALAEEESQHIGVFDRIRKTIPESSPSEGFDPYIEEAAMYLKALADSEVFTKPEGGAEAASRLKDEKAVVGYAIGMEKDSILFYYELQKMIRAKDKPFLDKLIEQEKDHLRKLTELSKKL